jgi:DNA repair protein RecN (Recombination protein N)
MLRFLKISNLAIIDRVEVEFHDGFNVLTGETGAGKSILIGALNLLLGLRASPDMIRSGEDEASVDALFEMPERSVLPDDLSALVDDNRELTLGRRLLSSGRSRCFINGNLVTLSAMQAATRALVAIFGQHEHYLLLKPDEHSEILDRFGRLDGLREQTTQAFRTWASSSRELERARTRLDELERDQSDNAAALQELTCADLKPDEESEIAAERDILKKAVQVREKAAEANSVLYSRSGSVTEKLVEARKAIDFLASVNPKLDRLKELFQDVLYRVEDLAAELRDVAESARSDPGRLEQFEERIALIKRLKKKYGRDVAGLLQLAEELNLGSGDALEARSSVRRLEQEADRGKLAYYELAAALSERRKKAAVELETAMLAELKELAMPHATFRVALQAPPDQKPGATGLEKAEFLIAANPGEAARPLGKVASGGELSRLMLALKALQLDEDMSSTVIFDEVDAGIGGHTATAVAKRLARVAGRQQVICITHLHQIAALAGRHFSVKKSVLNDRTRIEVRPLVHEERIEELARMLGASPGSKAALEHVRELMDLRSVEAHS